MPWQGWKGFGWMRRVSCSSAEQLDENVKDKYHPQPERVSHSSASLKKCSPSFKLAEQGWDSQLLSKGWLPINQGADGHSSTLEYTGSSPLEFTGTIKQVPCRFLQWGQHLPKNPLVLPNSNSHPLKAFRDLQLPAAGFSNHLQLIKI